MSFQPATRSNIPFISNAYVIGIGVLWVLLCLLAVPCQAGPIPAPCANELQMLRGKSIWNASPDPDSDLTGKIAGKQVPIPSDDSGLQNPHYKFLADLTDFDRDL